MSERSESQGQQSPCHLKMIADYNYNKHIKLSIWNLYLEYVNVLGEDKVTDGQLTQTVCPQSFDPGP